MPIRTSQSDPLRIDHLRPAASSGLVGMTLCPGKVDYDAYTGAWRRDLELDLGEIVRWGAGTVVTLMEDSELGELKVPGLGAAVTSRGIEWIHFPMADAEAPSDDFNIRWRPVRSRIISRLKDGGNVLLHCKGGLGRTGTVAALLMMEFGHPVGTAIDRVREARHGAIEPVQERYLRGLNESLTG